jgi:hypothetical protein
MSNYQKVKESISDRTNELYNELSKEEKEQVYQLFFDEDTRQELKNKLENIVFYKKPPTIEEFLDPENRWLPYTVIQGIFPHIKKELIEILDPSKVTTKVVEYGATRLGKTFMARLMIMYTIVYIHHLREPAMYYGLSSLTRLCIYFISFKFDKTRQLYLEPMFEIMRQSERFQQVKFEEQVRQKQAKLGRDVIVWSKAATTGEITLASGLQLQLGNSDAISAIGSDLLQCYISEIGFFIEQAGTTEEKIFELYTNISTRIYSTVRENFLAFVYLDTSANNAESMIEKHIINDLQFDEKTHFKWQSQWDARPDLFPIWRETGETFKVVVGNGTINPCIVTEDSQLLNVPKDLIIDVPIDAYKFFKLNLIKEIKDIAGRPTQSENKFIQDIQLINDIFNNPFLSNVEGAIVADSSYMPENLLWNQIKHLFFHKNHIDHYMINRAPREPRFIGLDTSYSIHGDATGITILHKEFDIEKKETVYVVDMSCAIIGKEKGINLEAVPYLLIDLITQASLPIYALYIDTFQSESSKQFLERNRVQVIKQSVDRDVTAYQVLLTALSNGLVKAGRNIFLRNNLQCLMVVKSDSGKDKIDHPIGKVTNNYNGDWENSQSGLFAKDVSDSLANALYGAFVSNIHPITIMQEEDRRFSKEEVDIAIMKNNAYQNLIKARPHLSI